MNPKAYHKGSLKGFTLVELLVVLSLVGLVLAGVFQFFFFTHSSYAMADSQSAVIQEVNLFFLQVEKDVRSASEPNSATKAVRVLDNGQQLDIYRYNNSTNMYERITYRRHNNDLQRGLVSTSAPGNDANPQYAIIPDSGTGAWTTLVSKLAPGTFQLFNDSRNEDESTRRLIDINVIVAHPQLNSMISMQTALMSRTGKSTTSIIESADSTAYQGVESVIIDPTSVTDPTGNGRSFSITASVQPSNATNRNLIWSQHLTSLYDIRDTLNFDPWLDFEGFSRLYDDGTGSYLDDLDVDLDSYRQRLTTRSGISVTINLKKAPWTLFTRERKTYVKVESPDGPSATLTITQSYR